GLSASAFTDSLMLMWVMGSWLAMERRQSFLSGFLLMVGFATKPQAIFFLPLLMMRGLWGHPPKNWLRFAVGMIIPLISLLVWDANRGTTSIFALGQYNYPTQGLITEPSDWVYRAMMWLYYLIYGINPILIILGIVMIFARAFLIIPISSLRHRQTQLKSSNLTRLLWGYVILYNLLHILIGIPMYDRYVLLIIPFIAILLRRHIGFLAILGVIPMAIFVYFDVTLEMGRDGYPVDSDGSIITLADEINALPFGAIVYDHWRGWELGYYLGAWSDKRRVYYPDPITQAQDSLNNPEKWTRYLVAPVNEYYEDWILAMQDVGYTVSGYTLVDAPDWLELMPSEGYRPISYHPRGWGYIIFALEPPPR
ncbi:MAG TPA: hypothetical protein PLZ51_11905, partial [Aggregatilineales bacterium]|nr:hypothetical protein [Aggregatilineales bacterium]